MHGTRHGRRVAALFVATAVVVAACGSGSGDDEVNPDEFGTGNTTDVVCRAGFDVDDVPPFETPMTGGELRYGLEAETDGWDAANNRWALSGSVVAAAIYDTLTKVAADGTIVPYLAESVEPNETFDVWTITVRDGVKFHDGSLLTAAAVKASLDAYANSVLTQPALSNIDFIDVVDDLTLEVNMKGPWVPFPQYLSSQIGVVMAPSMFDDPDRSTNPIGTGPFEFIEWQRDAFLLVTRNDDYWQTDQDGNALPYLDSIEFVPLPNPDTRKQSLDAGNVDVMHTFTASHIEDFRQRAESGDLNAYESCAWGEDEEFLLMFNNGAPPFDDPIAREAVARAVDRTAVIENLFGSTYQIATGPWAEGSPWYSPPAEPVIYDPERSRELLVEYEAKYGEPLTFTLGAPSSIPEALEAAQLTEQFLTVVGIDIDIETVEFATYVLNGVMGQYEANIWRQYGAPDPDGEYVWWHQDNVRPPGELSLNIARIDDDALSAALDRGRASPDLADRQEAYAEVQQIFRENFYLGFTAHSFWSVATAPNVRDLVNWTTPEGVQGMPLQGGAHPLAQVWIAR